MEEESPVRFSSLSSQVVRLLTERIYNGVYAPGSQLPPENQLADELNVSRATIRNAFGRLVERGLITRRQGVGTFVSRLSAITNPLNQFIDLPRRLAYLGFRSGIDQLCSVLRPAGADIARTLGVDPGSTILYVEKIFTANDEPVVFTRNHIPDWVFADSITAEQLHEGQITEPFFDFFASLCHHPIHYYTSAVRAQIASQCSLPTSLTFGNGCKAILILEDTGYDADERPLFYSVEHHFTSDLRLEIVTRVDIS